MRLATIATVLGCLLLGLVAIAAAPAAGAPPPEPFCTACGDAFESAAVEQDVNLTVDHSTVRIVVEDDGQATWVVRNRLADPDDAARLRADRALLLALTEDAQEDVAFLGANVTDGGVVTARYRDDDFATRTAGGTLRSDVFTNLQGSRTVYRLGADRLVVEAPEGMRVDWSVPGATVSDDGTRTTVTSYEHGFVTFVPRDSSFGPLSSVLAVGSMASGAVTGSTVLVLAFPALVFGGLSGAFARMLRWQAPSRSRLRRVATLSYVVSGGLAVALAALVFAGRFPVGGVTFSLLGAASVFSLLGVAFSRPPLHRRLTYLWMLAGAAGGIVLAVLATAVAVSAVAGPGPSIGLLIGSLLAAPLLASLPAGYALARKRWPVGIATAAAGFALAMLPLATVTARSGGYWPVVAGIGIVGAVLGAVLALPALVAGVSVAGGWAENEDRSADRDDAVRG